LPRKPGLGACQTEGDRVHLRERQGTTGGKKKAGFEKNVSRQYKHLERLGKIDEKRKKREGRRSCPDRLNKTERREKLRVG